MTIPLVSILIPAYNAEEWISETLASAVNQTWRRKEIIVVDDGSFDRTALIVNRFAALGVVLISQRNSGAAAVRNAALSASRGDFIQWLDADDLLAPDKISRQMEVWQQLARPRVLLSSAWGRFIYRPHRAQFVPTGLWRDLNPVDWLVCKLGHNTHMQTATWLVSRELTETAGPWNTRLLGDDDGEYFCRVLMAAEGVRFVHDARVYYRASGPNTLSYVGQSGKKIEAQWYSMKLTIGYLRSLEDSPRVHDACVTYLRNWSQIFHPDHPEVFAEAQALARELGGVLSPAGLSGKYSYIAALCGAGIARRAQTALPACRSLLERRWDRTLSCLERTLRPRRDDLISRLT